MPVAPSTSCSAKTTAKANQPQPSIGCPRHGARLRTCRGHSHPVDHQHPSDDGDDAHKNSRKDALASVTCRRGALVGEGCNEAGYADSLCQPAETIPGVAAATTADSSGDLCPPDQTMPRLACGVLNRTRSRRRYHGLWHGWWLSDRRGEGRQELPDEHVVVVVAVVRCKAIGPG